MDHNSLLKSIYDVFPVDPVPPAADCADLERLHPVELVELLGRSWQDAIANISAVDPADVYLLSDKGLQYYFPFFLLQPLLAPEGNSSWIFPEVLSARLSAIRNTILANPAQREAVLSVINHLMVLLGPDDGEERDFINEEELMILHRLLIEISSE